MLLVDQNILTKKGLFRFSLMNLDRTDLGAITLGYTSSEHVDPELTINGGTFNANYLFDVYDVFTSNKAEHPVTITGGTFNTPSGIIKPTDMSEVPLSLDPELEASYKNYVVSGGTFANPMVDEDTSVLAPVEGYEVIEEDGVFKVVRKVTEPVATNEVAPATVAEKAANTGAVSIISALAGALTVAALAMIGAVAIRKQIR